VKRYKSTTILGGGPSGKIVQCQSFSFKVLLISSINSLIRFNWGEIVTILLLRRLKIKIF
jgi:hypothetical protein